MFCLPREEDGYEQSHSTNPFWVSFLAIFYDHEIFVYVYIPQIVHTDLNKKLNLMVVVYNITSLNNNNSGL
jgi:hypothetical protein